MINFLKLYKAIKISNYIVGGGMRRFLRYILYSFSTYLYY